VDAKDFSFLPYRMRVSGVLFPSTIISILPKYPLVAAGAAKEQSEGLAEEKCLRKHGPGPEA
jgi:hypothetical protein